MRLRACALLLALAAMGAGAQELRADFSDPVAGVWRMTPGDALFEISHANAEGRYTLSIVDSPDYTVAPGAEMGFMVATATPYVYDATLCERPGSQMRRHSFFIEIDPEAGRLIMRPYRATAKISFRRWLPYLFRVTIERSNRPEGHDGAVRVGRCGATPEAL